MMLAGYKLLEKKDLNLSWTMQLNFTLCIPSGNFNGQLSTITPALPEMQQTLLFTATNSPNVATVLSICKNNPHTWELPNMEEKQTVAELDQRFLITPPEATDAYLVLPVLTTREE